MRPLCIQRDVAASRRLASHPDGACGSGGVPAVLQLLLKEGLVHGDCLTVTGKTLAENLEAPLQPSPQPKKNTHIPHGRGSRA